MTPSSRVPKRTHLDGIRGGGRVHRRGADDGEGEAGGLGRLGGARGGRPEELPGARGVLRRRAQADDPDAAGLAAEAGDGRGAGLPLELVVCEVLAANLTRQSPRGIQADREGRSGSDGAAPTRRR